MMRRAAAEIESSSSVRWRKNTSLSSGQRDNALLLMRHKISAFVKFDTVVGKVIVIIIATLLLLLQYFFLKESCYFDDGSV